MSIADIDEIYETIYSLTTINCPDIDSYISKLPNLDRYKIEELVSQRFCCGEVMNAIACIIKLLVSLSVDEKEGNFHLTPGIQKWITDIKTIASGVQGLALSAGVAYTDPILVIKIATSQEETDELVYEYIVGSILNDLRNATPCFSYMYDIFRCGNPQVSNDQVENLCSESGNRWFIISEKISGNTLEKEVLRGELTPNDLVDIILQILVSLSIAYSEFEYTHYDLHAKNIIIRKMREARNIKFVYQGNDTYILTRVIPSIIDYGLSRINYDGKIYANINQQMPEYWIVANEGRQGVDIYKFMIYLSRLALKSKNKSYYGILKKYFLDPLSGFMTNDFNKRRLFGTELDDKNYWYPFVDDDFIYITGSDILDYISSSFDEIRDRLKPAPVKEYLSFRCDKYTYSNTLDSLFSGSDVTACKNNYGNWKDKYGNTRYWYDCAKFYFDGKFNVVELPKGMSLYHGSTSLTYYNAEFPVGIEYYTLTDSNMLTSKEKEKLREDEDIENILSEKQKIGLSFFGNYEIATVYSKERGSDILLGNKKLLCGKNCISAYQLKKNAVFVDILDPFNIVILLAGNDLSEEAKNIIANVFGIEDISQFKDLSKSISPGSINLADDPSQDLVYAYHPLKRFTAKGIKTGTLRVDNYLAPKEMMKLFDSLGYAGYVSPQSPYREGSLKGQYRFAEIVFGNSIFDYIERDFANKLDWQYLDNERLFGTIGELVKDMKRYKTTNIDFHAGDLYAHSIWTALICQYMIANPVKWGKGIFPRLSSIIVMSAFLHDIGKAGDMIYTYYDKPEHPRKGFDYMIGKENYLISKEGGITTLNIDDLLNDLGMNTPLVRKMLSLFILSHWDFGKYLSRVNSLEDNMTEMADEYIQQIFRYMIDAGITNRDVNLGVILDIFKAIILISVADILAAQPFIDNKKFVELTDDIEFAMSSGKDISSIYKNLNSYIEGYPYLVNYPKTHRGGDKYTDFDIDDKGWKFREEILQRIPDNMQDF